MIGSTIRCLLKLFIQGKGHKIQCGYPVFNTATQVNLVSHLQPEVFFPLAQHVRRYLASWLVVTVWCRCEQL